MTTEKQKPTLGLAGRFQFIKHKADADGNVIEGTGEVVLPWFDNLITNAGLDSLALGYGDSGAGDKLSYCQLGTNATAPAFTDTALGARVGAASLFSQTKGIGAGNLYVWRKAVFRFAAGSVSGVNLSEVAVSIASTGTVFSRALLKDTGGSPTTITLAADEILDVVYELRVYVTNGTTTATFTIDGVSTSVEVEILNFPADASWSGTDINDKIGLNAIGVCICLNGANQGGQNRMAKTAYESNAALSGSSAGLGGVADAYVAGSYQRTYNANFGLADANFGTGVGGLHVTPVAGPSDSWGMGKYHFRFTPKIAKTNAKTATIKYGVSWGRYTP